MINKELLLNYLSKGSEFDFNNQEGLNGLFLTDFISLFKDVTVQWEEINAKLNLDFRQFSFEIIKNENCLNDYKNSYLLEIENQKNYINFNYNSFDFDISNTDLNKQILKYLENKFNYSILFYLESFNAFNINLSIKNDINIDEYSFFIRLKFVLNGRDVFIDFFLSEYLIDFFNKLYFEKNIYLNNTSSELYLVTKDFGKNLNDDISEYEINEVFLFNGSYLISGEFVKSNHLYYFHIKNLTIYQKDSLLKLAKFEIPTQMSSILSQKNAIIKINDINLGAIKDKKNNVELSLEINDNKLILLKRAND